MDEYASMRLRLDWASATTLPTVMVSTAMPHSSADQSAWAPRSDTTSTRMSAAKAAALEPVAMNEVMVVGAPWYTSGAHMWNGTEEILNPKPTSMRPRPASTSGSALLAAGEAA